MLDHHWGVIYLDCFLKLSKLPLPVHPSQTSQASLTTTWSCLWLPPIILQQTWTSFFSLSPSFHPLSLHVHSCHRLDHISLSPNSVPSLCLLNHKSNSILSDFFNSQKIISQTTLIFLNYISIFPFLFPIYSLLHHFHSHFFPLSMTSAQWYCPWQIPLPQWTIKAP